MRLVPKKRGENKSLLFQSVSWEFLSPDIFVPLANKKLVMAQSNAPSCNNPSCLVICRISSGGEGCPENGVASHQLESMFVHQGTGGYDKTREEKEEGRKPMLGK